MHRLTAIALSLAVLASPAPLMAFDEDDLRVMTVTGSGTVAAAPDMAVLSLGVTAQSESAGDALEKVAEAAGAILARLSEMGVAPADVQTESLDLSQVTPRHGQQTNQTLPDTFRASTLLSVRVRSIGDLGRVIDETADAGANQFRGVSFSVADDADLRAKARERAVEDALKKAGQLAEAADVELGDIIAINDQPGQIGPRQMRGMAMAAEAAMPVAEGEVSLTERVTIVIELSD